MKISSPPPIQSFQRLQVTDGLLITPEYWQQTQAYHRARQGFQFQALHQPGIITGLGVRLTVPNKDIDTKYRDGRWVEIQPGLAIDAAGSPIVVTRAHAFPISPTLAANTQLITIYLVITYRDPDYIQRLPDQTTAEETYKIFQKTSLDPLDVELCRIAFDNNVSELAIASNVHCPTKNTLDLRYRQSIRLRPEKSVQVACFANSLSPASPAEYKMLHSYNNLLAATSSLYPALQPADEPRLISLQMLATKVPASYDLIVCQQEQLLALSQAALPLRQYLIEGGMLCIHVNTAGTQLEALQTMRQELLLTLADLDLPGQQISRQQIPRQQISEQQTPNTPPETMLAGLPLPSSSIEVSLLDEIEANEQAQNTLIQQYCDSVFDLAQQIEYPIQQHTEQIERTELSSTGDRHLLLSEPFLFSQVPDVNQQSTHVFSWEGITLIVGNIAEAWALNLQQPLSRSNIRTTQEWGINLLHYASQRRQLIQLQASSTGYYASSEEQRNG